MKLFAYATIVLAAMLLTQGCDDGKAPAVNAPSVRSPAANAGPTSMPAARTTSTGLVIYDLKEGTGPGAIPGDRVTVHYTGKLTNGKVFDSSYTRGQPFQFVLGQHEVIAGWDEGVAGMKVGGKRRLVIPPSLGYGSQDMGEIPPNSTLDFEVELFAIN